MSVWSEEGTGPGGTQLSDMMLLSLLFLACKVGGTLLRTVPELASALGWEPLVSAQLGSYSDGDCFLGLVTAQEGAGFKSS